MTQSFQCISCGNQNAFGEPACTNCGQPFIYNCPICGSHINNHYDRCHGCGAAFYWSTVSQGNIQEKNPPTVITESQSYFSDQGQNKAAEAYPSSSILAQPITQNGISDKEFTPPQFSQRKSNSLFSSPKIWVILMIICIALMGLLLLADWFINKSAGG